jgi:hypothetical protein
MKPKLTLIRGGRYNDLPGKSLRDVVPPSTNAAPPPKRQAPPRQTLYDCLYPESRNEGRKA